MRTNACCDALFAAAAAYNAYRNSLSILVFKSEIIHFQQAELFANLVEKEATWSFGLK